MILNKRDIVCYHDNHMRRKPGNVLLKYHLPRNISINIQKYSFLPPQLLLCPDSLSRIDH